VSSNYSRSRATSRNVLRRAGVASAMFGVGAVAITGAFIEHISRSYAATHSSTTTTNGGTTGGLGGDSGSAGQSSTGSSGGQLSVPQHSQAPVGGSNGS
jgi:hypothetical protein